MYLFTKTCFGSILTFYELPFMVFLGTMTFFGQYEMKLISLNGCAGSNYFAHIDQRQLSPTLKSCIAKYGVMKIPIIVTFTHKSKTKNQMKYIVEKS